MSAQPPVEIVLYVDQDSLTLYMPGNLAVSLQDLGFEVVVGDRRLTYRLDQFTSFNALRFNSIPTPICFRLERSGSTTPLPLACRREYTFEQALSLADVFWYDGQSQTRTVLLMQGGNFIAFCPAGQTQCALTYVSPTFTPTSAYTPTPAPVPTSTSIVNIPANEQRTPQMQEFNGVMMVLVPTGCFMMGSTDEQLDIA